MTSTNWFKRCLSSSRSRVLAMTAGLILTGVACAQETPAAAASAAPASTPSADAAKIVWLEKMVKYLQTELSAIKEKQRVDARQQTSGGAGALSLKSLDLKITELQKKLEGHTHEYLLEGKAADGSIQALPQNSFPGSGLNSTGGARVGRAVIH